MTSTLDRLAFIARAKQLGCSLECDADCACITDPGPSLTCGLTFGLAWDAAALPYAWSFQELSSCAAKWWLTRRWNAPSCVFTEQFGDFKPKEHNLMGAPITETRFEPRVGGHIYDRAEDGNECRGARVLVYEPPSRVVFSLGHQPLLADRDRRGQSQAAPTTPAGRSISRGTRRSSPERPDGHARLPHGSSVVNVR